MSSDLKFVFFFGTPSHIARGEGRGGGIGREMEEEEQEEERILKLPEGS